MRHILLLCLSVLLLLPETNANSSTELHISCQSPRVKAKISRLLNAGYVVDEKGVQGMQLSLRKGSDVVAFSPCEGTELESVKRIEAREPTPSRDPTQLVPLYIGNLLKNQSTAVDVECFSETAIAFTTETDPNTKEEVAVLTVDAHKPRHLLCQDLYLVADREWVYYMRVWWAGTHTLRFSKWHDDEEKDVVENGVHVFRVQEGALALVRDAMYTKTLFGPRPAKKVKRFLQNHMNMEFVSRRTKRVDIDAKLISSGDIFAINRFSGSDMFIMYGTGSHIGHVAMALWMDSELYIVESIGGQSGWPEHGVIKTKYSDWMDQAEKIGYMVAWLPLDERRKEAFDADKAIKRFKELEGLPYGGHNFFFSWVDTPRDNFPPPLSIEAIYVGLPIFERINYNLTQNVVGEAFNKRMPGHGSGYRSIDELYRELDDGNLRFSDLLTTPEEDGWKYSDGESVVCSSLVAQLWIAGGVFMRLDVNGNEFHPKDTYQIKFFKSGMEDLKDTRPEQCHVDRLLPYCQILGEYRLELPGWNSVEPYNHMNEKCPTMPPLYERPHGC